MEFEVITGDLPQPTPPPEKVRGLIRDADLVVAILTRQDKLEGEEAWRPPAWIQHEIGMAYDAGKPTAIFVELGVPPSGIEGLVTQYERFDRTDLGKAAPIVVRYLMSIKTQLLGVPVSSDVLALSRALQNELSGMVAELMAPQTFADWRILTLAIISARASGKLFLLPTELVQKIDEAYDAHESMRKTLQERKGWKSPESMLVSPNLRFDTLPRGADVSDVGKLIDPALESQRREAIGKVFVAYLELVIFVLPPAARKKLAEEMAKSEDGGLGPPPPSSTPSPPP